MPEIASKASARVYIATLLGPGVLPQLYWLGKRPQEIPFNALPESYVIKPSHGSGWVRIVPHKDSIERRAIIAECEKWLAQNYYAISREWVYRDTGRCIMVEEFIDDGNWPVPHDYRLFTFGKSGVQLIEVNVGHLTRRFVLVLVLVLVLESVCGHHFAQRLRESALSELHPRSGLGMLTKHRVRLNTPDWKAVAYADDVQRPPHLDQMLEAAKVLCNGLDFIRVDFYDIPARYYIGEITTSPEGAMGTSIPEALDRKLGDYWQLPSLKELNPGELRL